MVKYVFTKINIDVSLNLIIVIVFSAIIMLLNTNKIVAQNLYNIPNGNSKEDLIKLSKGQKSELEKLDISLLNLSRNLSNINNDVDEINKKLTFYAKANNFIVKEDAIFCKILKNKKSSYSEFENDILSFSKIKFNQPTFEYGFQKAFIPISVLPKLIEKKSIHSVYPAFRAFTNTGNITSEGDAVLNAITARNDYGYDGSGIRIGVISDGVGPSNPVSSNSDLGAASGELPTVVSSATELDDEGSQLFILDNSDSDNTAEGIAMLEIVHDLAPGADLIFSSSNYGGDFLRNSITGLMQAGCNIIVDDNYDPGLPFFEINTGEHILLKSTIQDFIDNYDGIYLSASGNFQNKWIEHELNPDNNGFHLFDGSSDIDLNFQIPNNKKVQFIIQWQNKWGDAIDDINIELVDASGTVIASDPDNEIGADPIAAFAYTNTTGNSQDLYFRIKGESINSTNPISFKLLIKPGVDFLNSSDKVYLTNEGSIISHEGYSNVLAIGTSNWNNLDEIIYYSSYGPLHTYSVDNNGELSVPNPDIYKPDFISVDGVSISGAFGFGIDTDGNPNTPNIFYGTSAAAPHAAAIAALIRSARPNLTNSEVIDIMKSSTIKFGPYSYNIQDGKSNESGYGRLDALQAMENIPPIQQYSQCFDIVYADYGYICGEHLLYETTGKQFHYAGRSCSTSDDGSGINPNPNGNTGGPTGGGGGGPGNPSGGGGGGSVNPDSSVPVIKENKECKECLRELLENALKIKNKK